MGISVYSLLRRTERYLKTRGIEDARISAEELLRNVLGHETRSGLFCSERMIGRVQVRDYNKKIRQRAARIPLQYITEEAGFYTLLLTVTKGVLIPRPETEVLVEQVSARVAPDTRTEVLDLGTGSGNIAISLATERKQAIITAVDISAEALDCARANARMLFVSERIFFLRGDLFDAITPGKKFDCIVSNPPYIRQKDIAGLDPEVRCEPLQALDGGADGLEFYRRICALAPEYLKKRGFVAFEIGADQAGDVRRIMDMNGLKRITIHQDLLGRDRVCIGQTE